MNTFEAIEPTGLMQPKISMFFEFVHVYHIDTMKVVHSKRSSWFNRKLKTEKKEKINHLFPQSVNLEFLSFFCVYRDIHDILSCKD